MKIRKLLAAACGCFALLFGTTAARAAETTVAKIGETPYSSLNEAIKAAVAAKNATVEIVDDITFEDGDTWTPVRIGSDKTLVVNGSGKTIKNLPGCLFGTTHETEAQFGSVFTMTNLKFENPKIRVEAPGMTCAAVVLALAYGMDVTLDGVEIDGADVRGGSDSYVAGFVGWCNGVSGGGRKTVALRNCALRNSTLVSCGSVGGLVASTTPTLNEAVELVVENCEVVGNTIVGTELKNGAPRTELVGSVVGSIGAGDATVSATVSGNSVYGSTSAVDAETLTKDTDEVTAVYGRGNGGELTITGGSYDKRPFNAGDEWAKVAEWSRLDEQDGVFKVVDNLATLGNVKARQRYPWNGLVDVTFELKSKNAARVFIVAEYVDGGVTKRLPMAAATLVNDDKSESEVDVSTGFTVPAQATAKTVHVIWDSTAAVPTRLSGVTFRVYAK